MPSMNLITSHILKEVVANLEVVDVTGDGKDNIVLATVSGSLRVYEFVGGETPVKELYRMTDLVPVSSMGIGDVTGNGRPDFVVGGLDNSLRVVSIGKNSLELRSNAQLGNLPTSLVVANVLDDAKAEVIVATNDKALRCYGWFNTLLDKVAHKVVERPVFSMKPLRMEGAPYARFVFGDDTETLYVYQYADDRLHEISTAKVNGEVNLVATGQLTGGRIDEVVTASNGRTITLFSVEHKPITTLAKIRAPGNISSIRVGRMMKSGARSEGQVLVSLANSKLSMLTLEGREFYEEASIKTANKSADSLIAFGDINGDSKKEIVQAVGNVLHFVSIDP
ncbi:MAG: FG-GAP-like repeat-containing protein [Candidatus Thorarchaeota archaeon]